MSRLQTPLSFYTCIVVTLVVCYYLHSWCAARTTINTLSHPRTCKHYNAPLHLSALLYVFNYYRARNRGRGAKLKARARSKKINTSPELCFIFLGECDFARRVRPKAAFCASLISLFFVETSRIHFKLVAYVKRCIFTRFVSLKLKKQMYGNGLFLS